MPRLCFKLVIGSVKVSLDPRLPLFYEEGMMISTRPVKQIYKNGDAYLMIPSLRIALVIPHETSIQTASFSNSREQEQIAFYCLGGIDQLPFWARSAARLARADITNGPKVLRGSAHCMNVCYQGVSPR